MVEKMEHDTIGVDKGKRRRHSAEREKYYVYRIYRNESIKTWNVRIIKYYKSSFFRSLVRVQTHRSTYVLIRVLYMDICIYIRYDEYAGMEIAG